MVFSISGNPGKLEMIYPQMTLKRKNARELRVEIYHSLYRTDQPVRVVALPLIHTGYCFADIDHRDYHTFSVLVWFDFSFLRVFL